MKRDYVSQAEGLSLEQRSGNRFLQVLEISSRAKAENKPWKRSSLAEEFFRENPMPWLLDADPIDEPENKERRSA
jgi:hypothetical protein